MTKMWSWSFTVRTGEFLLWETPAEDYFDQSREKNQSSLLLEKPRRQQCGIYLQKKHTIVQRLRTVENTASIASRNEMTTFIFFSLNFSKMADVIIGAYGLNFDRNPLARPSTHLTAKETTMTLLSFDITLEEKLIKM